MFIRTNGALVVSLAIGCGGNNDNVTPDAAQADATQVAPDAPNQSGIVAVPLIGLGGGYTAKLEFGAQLFDVIVDTGSTSTGIAAATCTNCAVHPEYMTTNAVDLHQTANSQYGSGSWKGEVFEDAAAMGGRPAVMLDFASITSQTGFFQGPGFQGILGLGPDGLLLPHTTSYLTKLIGAGMPAELAFQLCPDSGTMWLGGHDAAAATTAPSFTPMLSSAPYYMVGVGSASVTGGTALSGADFGPTIIDTGTTLTFVPTAVETAMISSVQGASGYAQVFGSQALTDGACLDTTMTSAQIDAALPPLSLTFAGGTALSIPATRSYLFDQGGGQFCFTFTDSSALFGSAQKVSLFGNTLLAGMLTVIDVANHQIGFAPQQGCADPSFARRPMVVRPPSMAPAWRAGQTAAK
jgi:Eukaryotic aspartyl protease